MKVENLFKPFNSFNHNNNIQNMADYSDSDDDDNIEYQTTSVLLGYAEKEPIPDDDLTSHLGGKPVCAPSLAKIWQLIYNLFILFYKNAHNS